MRSEAISKRERRQGIGSYKAYIAVCFPSFDNKIKRLNRVDFVAGTSFMKARAILPQPDPKSMRTLSREKMALFDFRIRVQCSRNARAPLIAISLELPCTWRWRSAAGKEGNIMPSINCSLVLLTKAERQSCSDREEYSL